MVYPIDVDKIICEIRRDIEERELDGSILEFDRTVTDKKLINQMQFAEENALVAPNRKVKGSKVAQMVKRLIRKGTRFYVQPIVEDQNRYNMAILGVVQELLNSLEECETKLQKQEYEIKQLKKAVDGLAKSLQYSGEGEGTMIK